MDKFAQGYVSGLDESERVGDDESVRSDITFDFNDNEGEETMGFQDEVKNEANDLQQQQRQQQSNIIEDDDSVVGITTQFNDAQISKPKVYTAQVLVPEQADARNQQEVGYMPLSETLQQLKNHFAAQNISENEKMTKALRQLNLKPALFDNEKGTAYQNKNNMMLYQAGTSDADKAYNLQENRSRISDAHMNPDAFIPFAQDGNGKNLQAQNFSIVDNEQRKGYGEFGSEANNRKAGVYSTDILTVGFDNDAPVVKGKWVTGEAKTQNLLKEVIDEYGANNTYVQKFGGGYQDVESLNKYQPGKAEKLLADRRLDVNGTPLDKSVAFERGPMYRVIKDGDSNVSGLNWYVTGEKAGKLNIDLKNRNVSEVLVPHPNTDNMTNKSWALNEKNANRVENWKAVKKEISSAIGGGTGEGGQKSATLVRSESGHQLVDSAQLSATNITPSDDYRDRYVKSTAGYTSVPSIPSAEVSKQKAGIQAVTNNVESRLRDRNNDDMMR